ncbi:hypothetical protein Gorai_014495 [Gossypium raimondii]|uniref:Zinc knuckle CX2CX4HX4C domain-containing protein n=1 Tax=Gossypium raimondii TaxID=29730 RepID=A0A7J8P387_GOSRA|nr:hypothetical protein [Gossypium raimondii]
MANENNDLLFKLNFSNKKLASVQVREDHELSHTGYKAKVVAKLFTDCSYTKEMSCDIALHLGGSMGEVLAINWRDNEGGWTKYIQVRVVVDVFKPLHQVLNLWGPTRAEQLCLVKYECLPKFCYGCGLIRYVIDVCMVAEVSLESRVSNLQYRD